ncbi:alpha-hydroxy acid oxidase [Neolewinella lacunae]|uniref:Alpha-hydroxy-acid oxidizing protein n=1 Tax=Neolewinella lacunae TaxID=1517758 RepID=A0A923PTL8_9BACT|nr:alpha-hydroxy acid oxidase [Neolewinella lacunae]MBC6996592.1 alpha-hydroxy-acid oxidizing protein [Neolewinella lacunae]MDN3634844.1 alpha-hydroxy acid oxidase [Neolewinella lacunae]
MLTDFNSQYPSVEDLRERARRRIPRFAFEYLDGGCNEDINLHRNTADLREVQLIPHYLRNFNGADLKTTLFGVEYAAPVGISPIGLQGLVWPNATEILARASVRHNIPFCLSTVATGDIETVGKITDGKAWFQLYHPTDNALTDDLLKRAHNAGVPVLVLLCDVPSFGFRPRDIRNGLAMPPKMSVRNFVQIFGRPNWALRTLANGQPEFANLKPYMPKGLDMQQLGKFMDQTFSGRMNAEKVERIRERWKGKIVLKGVANVADAAEAVRLGLDGIIVSNHGGRQLDAGEASIHPLRRIAQQYGEQLVVMHDSGLRTGPDIARSIASGAAFTWMGRTFMYGTAALGEAGGNHTIAMLKRQLQQVMEQLCCERVTDLPQHLVR